MPSGEKPGTRRYVVQGDRRYLVVAVNGKPGIIVRWTDVCYGCTEFLDGHLIYGPSGCSECGYTGKRRRAEWVPLTA